MSDERITKEEAEYLVANSFLLTQELSRRTWTIEEEVKNLINFAKSFNEERNKLIGRKK